MLGVNTSSLSFLAEISITADRAHVAQALDRVSIAAIASYLLVDYLILFFSFHLNMLGKHLLEGGIAVVLNFLAHDCSDSRQLLGNKFASTITLAAWKTFLVHLGTVAFDAINFLKVLTLPVFIGRNEKIAGDVTVLDLDLHLYGLVVHVGSDSIAALVAYIGDSLRGHLLSVDTGVNHLLRGHDSLSVAASLIARGSWHNFGAN